jgi:hypothetical protein
MIGFISCLTLGDTYDGYRTSDGYSQCGGIYLLILGSLFCNCDGPLQAQQICVQGMHVVDVREFPCSSLL